MRTLGDLTLESGVLCVRDFGYDGHGLAAFARRLPPGREKERLYQAHVVDVERPNARLVSLRKENDCVIVDSGVGDGAYPCHWGVDANGEIARLFVDFSSRRPSSRRP